MKIMVFLQGTAIMHASAAGEPREQRVAQVANGERSVRDFSSYIPVEAAVTKLHRWQSQDATIEYLSSHRNPDDVAIDEQVLQRHCFPAGVVRSRSHGQSYAQIVERSEPDVLIEDDCASLGLGAATEVIAPQLSQQARQHITTVLVPEFGGIDHLPDLVADLLALGKGQVGGET